MGRYFGTDGFRGEANDILTADKAYKIAAFSAGTTQSSPAGQNCHRQGHKAFELYV